MARFAPLLGIFTLVLGCGDDLNGSRGDRGPWPGPTPEVFFQVMGDGVLVLPDDEGGPGGRCSARTPSCVYRGQVDGPLAVRLFTNDFAAPPEFRPARSRGCRLEPGTSIREASRSAYTARLYADPEGLCVFAFPSSPYRASITLIPGPESGLAILLPDRLYSLACEWRGGPTACRFEIERGSVVDLLALASSGPGQVLEWRGACRPEPGRPQNARMVAEPPAACALGIRDADLSCDRVYAPEVVLAWDDGVRLAPEEGRVRIEPQRFLEAGLRASFEGETTGPAHVQWQISEGEEGSFDERVIAEEVFFDAPPCRAARCTLRVSVVDACGTREASLELDWL